MRVILGFFVAAVATMAMAFSSPGGVSADPGGTQSLSTVPWNGFVNFQVTGMDPMSILTVSYSTGLADPWHQLDVGLPTTNSSGTGSYLFTPITAVDRGYQGPLWVQICDRRGTCVVFQITVGNSHPVIVGGNQRDQIYCDIFNGILAGRYPGNDWIWLFDVAGEHATAQLALRCGFREEQVKRILDYIFDD